MPKLSKPTIKVMEMFFKKINKIFPDFKIVNGEFAMITESYTTILTGKFKEKFDLTMFSIDTFLSFLNMYDISDEEIILLYNNDENIKKDNDDVLEYVFKFDNKIIKLKKPNIIMSRESSTKYSDFSSDDNVIIKFNVNKKEFINSLKVKNIDNFKVNILSKEKCTLRFSTTNNTFSFDINTDITFINDDNLVGKIFEFNIEDVSILQLNQDDIDIELKIKTTNNNSVVTLTYDVKLLDDYDETVFESSIGHVGTILS